MSTREALGVLRAIWAQCLLAGVGGALGMWIVGAAIAPPPLVVQDVHDVDRASVRGGWLRLHTVLHKNRDCESYVRRYLWQWAGVPGRSDRRWIVLPQTASPPAPLGDSSFELDLPLPGNIGPGQWYYRGVYRPLCHWTDGLGRAGTWLSTQEHATMDVPVPVENPPRGAPAEVVPAPAEVVPSLENSP